MSFHLKVVAIDRLLFEGDIDKMQVTTTDGQLTILPNHIPLVSVLKIAPLIIEHEGEKKYLAISGGYMSIQRHETLIVADIAEWAHEIDRDRVEEAEQRARHAIEHPLEYVDPAVAEKELQKAINRLHVFDLYHKKA
ncbi:MAG: ATP synthase F1 subunit epsilon [Culicoidibacterales bacterium]